MSQLTITFEKELTEDEISTLHIVLTAVLEADLGIAVKDIVGE